ncbi:DUF4153 domain-containing protein [Brevibacillus migulae]|uniref:DUF4153 domain-containing protein n=1 Tax=Brevibacillus migulae TaxID=1644114 RepID=UPI00106E4751|nr:DUF4173 domain-containing protein [Brevibacillus migulae]
MADATQWGRKELGLLGGSLLAGILFDFLFYGKELGVSYPLFVLAIYGLLCWQLRQYGKLQVTFEWLLTVPIALLSLTFFWYSNGLFHFLNFLLVPFLFVVQSFLVAKRNKRDWYKIGFVAEVLELVFYYTIKHVRIPFSFVKNWIKANTDKRKYGVAIKVLIGLGISLPLLLVVLSLLSEADSVFGYFLSEIPRMLFDLEIMEVSFRGILIGVVSIGTFAYLWSLLAPREESVEIPNPVPQEEKQRWDGIILVTILVVINLVYAAFTIIQISYLFSGAQTVLPDDMTYAEYARKGFNELVMVTIINFLILLMFMHLTSKEQPRVYRMVQILLSLLTVCTGFMLFSAYFRLSLYEEAYGYTVSRLLAHAFMLFLLVLFGIALVKIWREGISLIKNYALTGIAAYLLLNYINIDAIIAKNNISRYEETGKIDADYLTHLSYDAVPYLVPLLEDRGVAEIIKYGLDEMREEMDDDDSWQSFNWSKYRAKQLLDSNR